MALKRKENTFHTSLTKSFKLIDKLSSNFYDVDCVTLANSLLGKILVRKSNTGDLIKGRIVETECYPGGDDKASHSFNGRKTERNKPMYMKAGTVYVYFTYGMYYCFNISSQEPGGAVLIRALEPLEGIELMETYRFSKRQKPKNFKMHSLCNGPSKLCISLDIDKNKCNKLDLCENQELWIENDPSFTNEFQVIKTSRIGIDSAGPDSVAKPYRFYIMGNSSVSKRDKIAEKLLETSRT